jgi:histidine triad (HIT) family protein
MEPAMSHDPDCIFCKLLDGKIPSKKLYEDGEMLAFDDISPWAPVHFLVVPKRHVVSMAEIVEADAPLLGRMMALIPKLMLERGVTNGFRIIVNAGQDGLQEVPHLHLHAIGGPRPWAKG